MEACKITYYGKILLDLTSDTVTPDKLLSGVTAHSATGEKITGTLSVEDQLKASEYPAYVYTEVLEMVNKVRSVQQSDSIISIMMSDSHYPADQTATTVYASNVASSVQANQAAKALAYMLNIDFFAHLGDVCCGASTTTPDMLKSQIEEFLAYFREARSDLPVFLAIGNHDNGVYYQKTVTDGNDYIMSGEYMYNNFTAHSASGDTVMGNTAYGGYCYRDFDDKKLRVFLLNTAEASTYYRADQGATLGSQRVWLANALLDLNDKSDAADWGFIILCHYPADYGSTMPLSELLKAYVVGDGITISVEDGTSSTVNFMGCNDAKFIAQFHGHVHNFKTSKLHSYATGSGVQYDAHRVCIPNVQFDRENYYTTVGSYTDIDFSDDTTYTKTADSANGTSFVVNVINPSEEKIYSFCYGAGYDRVIGYGSVAYYSVTRELSNVTTDGSVLSIEEGQSFSEVITINSGCDMTTISVTMGGVDISSSALTAVDGGYQIDIAEVTGNVIITAKAQARPNFTNLVPYSIDSDGSDYYVDGDGYDNDTYINSSGTLSSRTGFVSTGFIPVTPGEKIIRIAGDGISIDTEYTRIATYDSSFNLLYCLAYKVFGSSIYNGALIEESATVLTYKMYKEGYSQTNGFDASYIRISTKGDGVNLIVTVDEEITYGGEGGEYPDGVACAVVQNLTNVTSSNTSPNVTFDNSFSTTLTAHSGYELGTVVVTMGGLDITSSVYSNGVISISSVTGNIVITATANAVQVSYTNQLPISTDTDGSVYNDVGYKADTYLSSGAEGSRSGVYTSGFIPVKYGDTLYFKNCTIQAEQSNHRFAAYDSSKAFLSGHQHNTTSSQISNIGTPTYGSDGNMTSLTISGDYWSGVEYIRFCCSGLDGTSIVTVNEPIE